MITRIFGWVLIFLQFLTETLYREQIIAIQTIYCAWTIKKIRPYHMATIVLILILTVEIGSKDITRIVLFHVAVFSAVYIEYFEPQIRWISRVSVVWIIRWLAACNEFYDSPMRSCTKCILYIIVANFRYKYLDGNFYKCLWILLVNELFFIVIPIVLLREIYQKKKKKRRNIYNLSILKREKRNHIL